MHAPTALRTGRSDPMQGCSAAKLANSDLVRAHSLSMGNDLAVVIYTVANAVIVGDRYPLVFAPTHPARTPLWESHLIRTNFDWDLQNNLQSSAWLRNARSTTLETPVLFLAGSGSDNFYHWMHDCIPRLMAAQRAGIDLPILIPPSSPANRFIRESLSLLGISDDKIIEHPGGKLFVPEVVLVEDLFCHRNLEPHRILLNETRHRFLRSLDIQPVSADAGRTQRIFLSREGVGTTRTLINQLEVESLLGESGFRKVQMEQLPLADQIRLLANAEEVVAPHGAGLFHTLFMTRGHVVEFFPQHPEHATDPTRILVEPCWSVILGCHADQGHPVTWDAINCAVEMLSTTDFSQYRLRVDLSQLMDAVQHDPFSNRISF